MTELPPPHVDTAQQKLALRRNRAAKHIRTTFPRGTRVEATNDMGKTGNGRFGTVSATILGGNSLGGVVKVLWDDPSPVGGKPVLSNMNRTSLRVIADAHEEEKMTVTTLAPMTQAEIVDAAKIIEGCRATARVTWAVGGDVTSLLTGALRYIERTNHATGESAASDDVRDQYVRITTTFEHWLKMSDVLALMADGLLAFEH